MKSRLENYYAGQEVDVNIGVQNKNGNLVWVIIGIPDETNNSLFFTYRNHSQKHPKNLETGELIDHPRYISTPLKRNVPAKIARAVRVLLSGLTRPDDQKERLKTKEALKKATIGHQIDRLAEINLSTFKFGNLPQNENPVDMWKRFAFQIGQTSALIDGKEYFDKDTIWQDAEFAGLKGFLRRTDGDFNELERVKNKFVEKVRRLISANPAIKDIKEST